MTGWTAEGPVAVLLIIGTANKQPPEKASALVAFVLVGSLVVMAPLMHQPNQTVPTGFSGLPPLGPATPVTATDTCALDLSTAPMAMAWATASLTAPCVAINSAGTPSI